MCNPFPRISNSFPRIGQLVLSDCNSFPRIRQLNSRIANCLIRGNVLSWFSVRQLNSYIQDSPSRFCTKTSTTKAFVLTCKSNEIYCLDNEVYQFVSTIKFTAIHIILVVFKIIMSSGKYCLRTNARKIGVFFLLKTDVIWYQ